MPEKKKRSAKVKPCLECVADKRTPPNPALPLHTCPFKEEIHKNSKDLCNCCAECRRKCADEI